MSLKKQKMISLKDMFSKNIFLSKMASVFYLENKKIMIINFTRIFKSGLKQYLS